MKKFLIGLVAGGFVAAAAVAVAQQVPVYTEQGGAKMVVGSGGELEVQSGATLDVQSGSTVALAGDVTLTALVETVTATNVITAAESGTTFILSSATEFVSTLPAPAAGLQFTFIVGAAPVGAAYTVVTTGSANIINARVVELDNGATAVDAAGPTLADADTITFTASVALAGDMVTCTSDGTSYFCYGVVTAGTGAEPTQESA